MGGAIGDCESQKEQISLLLNTSVESFSWNGISVSVKDRSTKKIKNLVTNASGFVRSGELLALMGPSGSGKTTLLNSLAYRDTGSASINRHVLLNGTEPSRTTLQDVSSYVEQEDALIGSLTVREMVDFSARLGNGQLRRSERQSEIDKMLGAFGLSNQSETLIGTPLRKGISGGQKRRASVAAQLITNPKILFLDEPTSGLDSAASFEIVSYLRRVAKQYNLLVIASIHQPSSAAFELFDKIMLLSQGHTCYFGPRKDIRMYFKSIGYSPPQYTNIAEYLLELTNTDFSSDPSEAQSRLDRIHRKWAMHQTVPQESNDVRGTLSVLSTKSSSPGFFSVTTTLLHRMWLKSYRDVVAYGIRMAMYLGLAIMMGTVWLRLQPNQESIQSFINALFFGSAFMSFMAVAYVPAFVEDHAVFVKDRKNGLYGALPFLLANFLIGIPFLFLFSVLFSTVAYWLPNFRSSGTAFLTSIMWLFLDLLAAESLVVLVSSIFPIFVVALAIVAFVNGLWMSVGGFLVTPTILNVFWRYVFHYIDYQTYVFQGMMVNEFGYRTYACDKVGDTCQCMYQTELASQCMIDGRGVLATYGYPTDDVRTWVGILCGIIIGYRIFCWAALHFLHR